MNVRIEAGDRRNATLATWFDFVRARVLVMADSSYSISAALVRKGLSISLDTAAPPSYTADHFPCVEALGGGKQLHWRVLDHGLQLGAGKPPDCRLQPAMASGGF